jgi:N-acetylmuramoyl-L-alanine amidase
VELHFNASDNEQATGTAMLYHPGSVSGKKLSTLLFEETEKVLKLGEWPKGKGGVLTPFQASGAVQNGLTNLKAGRAPASLLEPFFGSNQKDCRVASAQKKAYAAAILRAVERMAAARQAAPMPAPALS